MFWLRNNKKKIITHTLLKSWHPSWVGKSVLRITVWHYMACQVMKKGDCEGQIFLSHLHTNNRFFFLLTTKYRILHCFLFDLVLYIPSTIFQLCWDGSELFLGWASTKLGLMCLAQGYITVMPVRLQPVAPRSWVKNSTTEPLRCLHFILEKHENSFQKILNSLKCDLVMSF